MDLVGLVAVQDRTNRQNFQHKRIGTTNLFVNDQSSVKKVIGHRGENKSFPSFRLRLSGSILL